MYVAAFLIACALIAAGGALVARADWAVAPRGRGGLLERAWIVLPAAFLVVLLVLTARSAWS